MNRAEIRRSKRNEEKRKTAVYNLTQAQLDAMIYERLGDELIKIKQQATYDAINTSMTLLLALPLEVLMHHYWKKSFAKRIPKFISLVLEYYRRWADGELDIDELRADLWEYGGVRLEETEEGDML